MALLYLSLYIWEFSIWDRHLELQYLDNNSKSFIFEVKWRESCSVMSNFLLPRGL